MKITSLLFWVQENAISEKFYKKLGFKLIHSDDSHSVVSLDNFEVQLVNIRDDTLFARDSMAGDRGRGMYVYVHVEDVDAEYQRQVGLGLRPTTEPKHWEWGNREFILKDPDGYKLCFWQKTQAKH